MASLRLPMTQKQPCTPFARTAFAIVVAGVFSELVLNLFWGPSRATAAPWTMAPWTMATPRTMATPWTSQHSNRPELAQNDRDLASLTELDSLTGRYGHYDYVAYQEQLGPTTFKTYVITYGFTDLFLEGGQLFARDSYCHAEHTSNQPFQTIVPDAFTRMIKPPATPVQVTSTQNRATGTTTLELYRPESPTPIGLVMADPVNDPFPTTADDPRISDDDGDGKPGVTVRIKMFRTIPGELQIARREIFSYRVQLQADASLRGVMKDRSDQIVLAANPKFLKRDNNPKQYEDPRYNRIFLIPLPDETDCDMLMEQRDQLFPANPPIWSN